MLGLVQMPPLSQGHAQVAGSFDTTPFPGFASGNGFIANLAIDTQNDDRANPSFDGPSTLNSGNGAFFIPTFDAGGWQRATAVAIRASGRILISVRAVRRQPIKISALRSSTAAVRSTRRLTERAAATVR